MRAVTGVSFSSDRMQRLARIEAEHFWFVARREVLCDWLKAFLPSGSAVVDVGAGTGFTLGWLRRLGYRPLGVEPLWSNGRPCDGAPVVRAVGERLPLRSESFDAVLFLDVLEHVDDLRCLLEARSCLRKGGFVVVSVPALPWLWSKRDEEAGHRRRYTKAMLRQVLEQTGFEVLEIRYHVVFLLPALILLRFVGRFVPSTQRLEEMPGNWVNRIGASLMRWETRLARHFHWPVGSTLLAIARSRAEP